MHANARSTVEQRGPPPTAEPRAEAPAGLQLTGTW